MRIQISFPNTIIGLTKQPLIKAAYRKLIGYMPIGVRSSAGYYRFHGSLPHLRRPAKFTEMVQYRKVYDRDTRLPELADKVLVKEFVSRTLGEDWIIPTLWHGSELPARNERPWRPPFVLKANNGCHTNAFILSDADLNWDKLEQLTAKWFRDTSSPRNTFHHRLGEWHYNDIKPQLLVEPYIGKADGTLPVDYKLWTFHGRVELIQIDTERATDHKRCFYSPDWIKQPFGLIYPIDRSEIERPVSLDAMIAGAQKLAYGLDFVRIDCYELNARPLFGEMTFFPDSGYGVFTDEKVDYELGELWRG